MAPVTMATAGGSDEQPRQALQKPTSKDSATATQEEPRSPNRDAVERPSTPDTCLDCNVSPCSLSVSDDPSNFLELDQVVVEDLGHGIATMSLLGNGRNGHKMGSAGREREGSSLKTSAPETAAAADGQPGEISKVIQHVKEAIAQHRRHPSNLSAPDSDISSSGTFVDKGSCEELNRVGRPEDSGPEHSEPEPKPVESEEVAADIVAKASHDSDILKPPESAFSTSDISEQMSGPVNEEDALHCLACKVTTTSEEQLAIHKEGKRHRRHLAMAELQESPPATADPLESSGGSQDLHCDLCQVTAPTPQHREYHLRGQKHQRREKQHQLMEASAELASSSVNALLTESDDEPAAANERSTEETAEAGETAEGKSSSAEVDGTDQRPLKSPFEEFAPPKTAPPKPPLQQTQPPRNVRFNGSLQSFSEEPEDVTDEYGPNPPLPPLGSNVSTSSYKLMSGGSFSSPAAHYCPVCGIIATSGANLEDHYQGRRHARRLQYLSHMPDGERNEHLQRTLTAASSGLFRQGSLVLPSSMDLTAYIGAVAQVHPPPVPPPAPMSMERAASLRARRSLNKTLSNQQLSWDSVNGLHLHREDVAATADSKREGDEGEAPPAEAGEASQEQEQRGNDGEEHVLEPQPKCDICGITTTSQAHMEAHRAGRKHRRRVEAAAGRSTVKSSAHYCPLCEISTTSSAHLALHLVGRAHRRRQKALEEGESLHPVSLLQPTAAVFVSDSLELRSNGDAVSSSEIPASNSAPAVTDATSNGWYASNGTDNSRGPPPLSGRAHSQPESQHPVPPTDAGRATNARAQSAELKAKSPPRSVLNHRPPIPRNMTPVGLPPPPSGYPMGMYPYAQPYFQQGNMSPYPPGPGSHPGFSWWPGAIPHPAQHPAQGRLPFQNGMYSPMGQYPGPGLYPGAPPQYPMMGVSMPGSYPGVRLPGYPGYEKQGFPALAGAAPREWSPHPQQDTYNCEVCNVQTEKLDDLKQHLRGKQHKRRLYTPTKPPWN